MRVLDCNVCGETLRAPDDEALARAVAEHYGSAHDGLSGAEASQLVAAQAYDAMDS